MRNYHVRLAAPLAACVFLVLAGCSKPVLDYRNAEVVDGLIYADGANEPFTGSVTNVPDSFMFGNEAGFAEFMQQAGGDDYAVARFLKVALGNNEPDFLCTATVREGYVDGSATCHPPRTDVRLLEANFESGRLSGGFAYYSPQDPGQVAVEGKFVDGQPDGVETIYAPSKGEVLKRIGWSKGSVDGAYAQYNPANGKLVLEGRYASGKREGLWKQYAPDNGNLIIKASYHRGLLEGTEEHFDPDTGQRTVMVDKWIDGKLTGSRKSWDKAGNLVSYETYDDGVRTGSREASDDAPPKDGVNQDRLEQALGNSSTEAPASGSTTAQAANGPSASSSPVHGDGSSTCTQGWIDAFQRDAARSGADGSISNDQMEEWREWCHAGKQAPVTGG